MAEDAGTLGRSHEGIEIWNRSWQTVKDRVFPDDIDHLSKWSVRERMQHGKLWKTLQYWFTPAGTVFVPEVPSNAQLITAPRPIGGLHDIFVPGFTVMDVGCGGGRAALGMAKENGNSKILAVDYELGRSVPMPKHHLRNLTFQQEDWRSFSLPDNSIDAFVSDQGIARYGGKEAVGELTRIAKPGALFRGTQTRGLWGRANFDDLLAQSGWDVWHLRYPHGDPSQIIIAKLKQK